jgi:two-component system, NtrC family, sensor kinase
MLKEASARPIRVLTTKRLHPAHDPANRRILIVDDNSAIHADFQKILCGRSSSGPSDMRTIENHLFGEAGEEQSQELEPFTINSALQGREALELVQRAIAERQPYALAFIDMRMPPGWDGIETASEIWKVDPTIQIVICTAYSDYSWHDVTAKLGRSDRLLILKKPFDNIEVAQMAEALTSKWELTQVARRKLDEMEILVEQRTLELTSANHTLRDEIEQRKAMEHERQLMESQLRQAQKLESIGQLAAGIAHEINTPTQYVGDNTHFIEESWDTLAKVLHSHEKLYLALEERSITDELTAEAGQLLKGAGLDYFYQQIPEAIKAILEGVDRVTKVVCAMKEFAHPGSAEKVPSDLNRAIETTITVAQNEWKYIADLGLDLDSTLPLVPCFLDGFNQSILNLVVNAAHAIGDVVKDQPGRKGRITIQTRHDGENVEIRVSDNGTGIPEAARPHVFEPFFTTKGVGNGSGQGLSIVYGSIVKKHGGDIRYETESGKGTTFVLRLPINGTTVPAAQDRPAA